MKVLLRVAISLVLLESVFVIHEYGHLRELQKRGVQVEEFSLGIGPALYQYKNSSYQISLRLIPIMAYVSRTADGQKFFEKNVSFWGKFAVHSAGVRNNVLSALFVIFGFQVLAWRRGKISIRELVFQMAVTPVKFILRFLAYLAEGVSFNKIDLGDRFLLSTGGISPSNYTKRFITLSLFLAMINFLPINPFDGGHTASDVLSLLRKYIWIPSIPEYLSVVVWFSWYLLLFSQKNMTSREVALLCTTDMATEYHIHPEVEIVIKGVKTEIPANMGVQAICMTSIHTHEGGGVIHVESPVQKDFTLGDFFAVWKKSSPSSVPSVISLGMIGKVTVNGIAVNTYEDTIFKDKDKLVVTY